MTIPSLGPVVSLSFVALIDDPALFGKTHDVGAFLTFESRVVRLAAKRGFREGVVATARKVAVLMPTLWAGKPTRLTMP